MAPSLSEDEIDDLLYFARTGDKEEFDTLTKEICQRETIDVVGLLEATKDEESGNGILHMAAANGHDGLLAQLCKALSNPSPQNPVMLAIVNAQNKAGNTPLHWAALNGHLEAVKVLLEQGSDPTIANQRGHDAVYEAELNDKKEVVEWVLKEGGEGLEEGFGGQDGEGEGEGEEADENVGSEDGPAGEEGGVQSANGQPTLQEQLASLDLENQQQHAGKS